MLKKMILLVTLIWARKGVSLTAQAAAESASAKTSQIGLTLSLTTAHPKIGAPIEIAITMTNTGKIPTSGSQRHPIPSIGIFASSSQRAGRRSEHPLFTAKSGIF